MAARAAAATRKVLRRFPVLVGAVIVLVVAGIVLLIIGGSSQIVAGAASLLAAVGLTWKGVGDAIGQLAGRFDQPVWQAVLDAAIANAITLLPNNEGDQRGRGTVATQAET